MKVYLILFVVFGSYCSLAQDTLCFQNGEIKAVEIIKIDSAAAIIEYEFEEQTIYQGINSFNRIIYQGQEINLDYWINRSVNQNLEKTNEQLLKSNRYSYGKFAISTNLTSFVGDALRRSSAFFYDNTWFSIEPEYWFHDRLSVKFPILIGLEANLSNSPKALNLEISSWDYWVDYNWETGFISAPEIQDRQENYYLYDGGGHHRNLQFQLGINPKFYLTKNRRVMPYIGQSISVAFLNMKTIDYFTTYSETVNAETGVTYYTFEYEEQLIYDSQSATFKYEGMFGLNFNLTRGLNFTTEVGYSNRNKAVNDEADRVYLRTDVLDEFKLVKTSAYSAEERYRYGLRGKCFARIHLVYRFGGVQNAIK
ncbi:MAG: hypothetical protein ACI8ZM_002170 [Crocinitomix sp.]